MKEQKLEKVTALADFAMGTEAVKKGATLEVTAGNRQHLISRGLAEVAKPLPVAKKAARKAAKS